MSAPAINKAAARDIIADQHKLIQRYRDALQKIIDAACHTRPCDYCKPFVKIAKEALKDE